MNRTNSLLVALALVVSCTASIASAQIIYVAPPPLGSNANPGTIAAPLATISFAVAMTMATTINVLPGTYTENVVIDRDVRLEGLGMPRPIITPAMGGMPTVLVTDIAAPITRATLIKNFEFVGGSPAIELRGVPFDPTTAVPEFGFGMSAEVTQNTFTNCSVGIAVNVRNDLMLGGENRPWIRFNELTFVTQKPFGVGIQVVSDVVSGAPLFGPFVPVEPLIEANRISGYETGIRIVEVFGDIDATIRCDWIFGCRRGIVIDGGGSAVAIRNETVADGLAIGPLAMIGVEVLAPAAVVDIDSTILSIPTVGASMGNDLSNPSGAAVTFDFSMSADPADIALGVGNILRPVAGPGFVGLGDYHLTAGSPAVNAGFTAQVMPMAATAVPYDNDGAPRILDGTRTSTLAVDMGGSEFTTVALDVVAGMAGPLATATNATPRIEDITIGTMFSVVVTSAAADLCVVTLDFANTTNAIAPPPFDLLGNLLVAPVVTFTVPLANIAPGVFTGSLLRTAPGVAFAETEVDFQAALFSTAVAPPTTGIGNMSRRVRVEFNE